MLQQPQYEPKTNHYFADGMYCREVWRPKNCLIVGKVHKYEHFYFVMSGTVNITDGDSEAQIVDGPRILLCKPGTKRAVFALTDATCCTVHRLPDAELRDIEEIEKFFVEEDITSPFLPGNRLPALEHKE